VRAHAANVRSGLVHHARFRPLNLIVDLTTKKDQVVILVVGLAYRGIVLPLAVRTWPHNTTLVDGTYYQHLLSALAEVNTRLPAELREHVILVGDRAFGVPRMVDAASALGWAWVLRVQGQVRVRLPNHTVHPIRSLAPERGALWRGGFGHVAVDDVNGTSPTVSIFKEAGWRSCQVIAVWDEAADEPWLLISNLPASQAQIRSYAQRWAIERLFLSWKSHGWDLEVLRMRTPETIGRMIASMALATHWCLMIGAAHAEHELHDLALRAQKRASAVYQPRLPGLSGDKPDHRPYPAKYSLFSWGRQIIADTACRSQTPAFCPTLPNWQAPNWSIECAKIFEPAA
jgi:hypothetical protein